MGTGSPHERWDGSGYPDGLSGDAIPLKARILQIADIYDALITDRPYRDALRPKDALDVLHKEASYGWLDGSLVSALSQISWLGGYVPVRGKFTLPAKYV